MGTFWLIAALMIAASLALVLPPMLGRRRGSALSRTQLNLATYRDRFRELEAARATGALGEEDYGQARAELERAMLDDLEAARRGDAAEGKAGSRVSAVAAVVVAVAIPLASFGLYLQLGSPEALEGVETVEPAGSPHVAGNEQLSLEQMITRLEERLRQSPDDGQGWLMLARSYAFSKRDEQAREAFRRAIELEPRNPLALIGYAETITRLAGGRVTDEARSYAERALEVNPDIQPALWLTGMAAFQRGDNATALARWRRIRAIGGLNLESARVLESFIARAEGAAAPAAGAGTNGSAQPEKAAESASAASPGQGGGGASLRVRVALAPEIAAEASPEDTVFIFARAATGPPMPLAVVRRKVSDLPVTVTLDDSMAMTAQMRLSAFPEVVVGARVSRSGAPTPTSGDLQGLTPAVRVAGAGLVEVAIDRVLP